MTDSPRSLHAILLITVLCSTGSALAQSTPAPTVAAKPAANTPAPAPVVTVAGERPTNRIDRQVYDVKSDISATNGTAADALNNVPSVAVDPDGTVTLRGSTNVQVLVDGKPSAMMQGENRGATLNAMTADDIDSIEVINNPGAQFGNEAGGGPILNLIMKRNRAPGGLGAVNVNAGTAGRYNSAASGSYNEGPWGFQGGVNVRHDGRNSEASVMRDGLDERTGTRTHGEQTSRASGLNDSIGLNGAVNYNFGKKDTLGASVAFGRRSNDQEGRDHYLNLQDSSTLSDYIRSTERDGEAHNYQWGMRMDHKGEADGETFKLDLRVSSSTNTSTSDYANTYTVAPPTITDSRGRQHNATETKIVDFTGDYERNVGSGMMKLGYKLASNANTFDVDYTDIDPGTLAGTPNALRSNLFVLDEKTAALYGSYQMRINERWGALLGLRAEYTDLNLHQAVADASARNHYVNYLPSFFATYKISELSNLRFSYAHRLRRPGAADLNPFVQYRDEFNVSSGNPYLHPVQTDSVELGYETRLGALEANLRGYFRKDDDAIVDHKVFISDTVVLTTRENGPGLTSGGLEFTLTGKLTPTLTLNTSGNLARSEQRMLNDPSATRSASSLSGRVRLSYAASEHDQLQLVVHAQGKTLAGQGYREPYSTVNASWRHALTPTVNLVFNITDAFSGNKNTNIVDTSYLHEVSTRRFDSRIAYVGLSFRFGGAKNGGGARRGRGGPPPGAREAGDGPAM
ncbi:MAG: TonB-dependent receptor domain-containing protein [Massilia sp.]